MIVVPPGNSPENSRTHATIHRPEEHRMIESIVRCHSLTVFTQHGTPLSGAANHCEGPEAPRSPEVEVTAATGLKHQADSDPRRPGGTAASTARKVCRPARLSRTRETSRPPDDGCRRPCAPCFSVALPSGRGRSANGTTIRAATRSFKYARPPTNHRPLVAGPLSAWVSACSLSRNSVADVPNRP